MRCDDRGVEVDGGDLLTGAAAAQLADHIAVDGGESGERFAFGGDDAGALQIDLLLLRLPGLFLVVKLAAKLARGFGGGRLIAKHRRHAGIFAQDIEVVEAFAAHGVEGEEAFDIGGFVQTPAVLFELQVALDACGQAETAGRAQEQRQSAERGEDFLGRRVVDCEQKLAFGRAADFF